MAAHFVDELRSVFAERAGQPALIRHDRIYTYGELDERVRTGQR